MENLFSGRYIFPVLIALFFFCSATGTLGQTPAKRDVTCIIAADLHFDFLPETDQYYHVVAMNRVPGHWVMPSGEIIRKIDAVILAGDLTHLRPGKDNPGEPCRHWNNRERQAMRGRRILHAGQ